MKNFLKAALFSGALVFGAQSTFAQAQANHNNNWQPNTQNANEKKEHCERESTAQNAEKSCCQRKTTTAATPTSSSRNVATTRPAARQSRATARNRNTATTRRTQNGR